MKSKKLRHGDAEARKRVAEASKSIRRKFMNLRMQRADMSDYLDKSFEPIVTPLKQLTVEKMTRGVDTTSEYRMQKMEKKEEEEEEENVKNEKFHAPMGDSTDAFDFRSIEPEIEQNRREEAEEEISEKASEGIDVAKRSSEPLSRYVQKLVFGDANMDRVYGIKYDNGEFKLGDSTVNFVGERLVVDSIEYPDSPGLYKLIFLHKPPSAKEYTSEDLETYKSLLMQTNAHMQNDRIRANRGPKYAKIISKLFPRSASGRGLPSRLPTLMEVTRRRLDYIYWDDPNELVDRLRLLLSSKSVGHTGHDNEIMSIIEELREADIIY